MNEDPDSPSPSIDISLADPLWLDAMPNAEGLVEKASLAALAAADLKPLLAWRHLEMSIVLADDATVHELNRTYRGKDRPTNVLSFANDDAPDGLRLAPADQPCLLGDIILARGVTFEEARLQGKRIEDHLTHLVVHGVLHLLGYDHEEEAEAQAMEALETKILADLGIADPYCENLKSESLEVSGL